MIKNVKWFFVVLVFSSVISLAFSKENVHAEKLQEGDKIPTRFLHWFFATPCSCSTCTPPVKGIHC